MKLNLNLLLLLFGSAITLAVGLLTAYIPGLAYVTVYKYFLDVPNPPFPPYVSYPPLDISTHLYSAKLLVSATGGLIGLMGLFWKKTTNKAAIVGAISSIMVALLLKSTIVDLPWMDQMFYTMLITIAIIAGVSMSTSEHDDDPKAIHTTSELFKTDSVFNISSYIIFTVLAILYVIFW